MTVENNYAIMIAIASLSDWFKNLGPVSFQPMRSKTRTNITRVRAIFSALWASYRKFPGILIGSSLRSLISWLVGVTTLFWSWFFDSPLKTALFHRIGTTLHWKHSRKSRFRLPLPSLKQSARKCMQFFLSMILIETRFSTDFSFLETLN